MIKELEQDNLHDILDQNDITIVQYSASWCGNCKVIKPKFKRFSEEYEQAQFVLVDAEKFPESRKYADVSNLPTFAAFKGDKLINQIQTNKADLLKTFIHEITSN